MALKDRDHYHNISKIDNTEKEVRKLKNNLSKGHRRQVITDL
jgi:hypothetical protein